MAEEKFVPYIPPEQKVADLTIKAILLGIILAFVMGAANAYLGLYVGMTGLDPEERFARHQQGHKANRYVTRYGLRLRPDLYEHLNPMTYERAQDVEVQLADSLRKRGYAVWQS